MNRPGKRKDNDTEIQCEILRYLVDRPKAQDTLKGIIDWWIPIAAARARRRHLVEQALEKLKKRSFVLERKGKDSTSTYKINELKHDEIISFLTHKS